MGTEKSSTCCGGFGQLVMVLTPIWCLGLLWIVFVFFIFIFTFLGFLVVRLHRLHCMVVMKIPILCLDYIFAVEYDFASFEIEVFIINSGWFLMFNLCLQS